MPRMLMPDDACRGIDVEGARSGRTTHYSGHIVDVDNPQHVKALRHMGATVAGVVPGAGAHRGGFTCPECGFRGFFARCGRCGASCERAA